MPNTFEIKIFQALRGPLERFTKFLSALEKLTKALKKVKKALKKVQKALEKVYDVDGARNISFKTDCS